MGTTEAGNVIHRKTRVAREGYQARAMSPAKALRLALAQSADRELGLALTVTAVEQTQIAATGLPGALGEGGLLVLLDGPGGLGGALRLDAAFLAALIEVQTTGRVTGRPAEDRAVTRTDAAIAAPLIDAALARFAELLSEETPDHWGAGWRFGAMAEDVRSLGLALTEAEYHHFRLMVEIGEVAQPGILSLLLPVRPCAAARPDCTDGPARRGATLEHSALDAPVRIDAVLTRLSLPLDRVCTLRAGDLLPLSVERPLTARLEVGARHKLARARLGQMHGFRAVRVVAVTDAPPEKTAVPAPPPPAEPSEKDADRTVRTAPAPVSAERAALTGEAIG